MADLNNSRSENNDSVIHGQTNPSFHENLVEAKTNKTLQTKSEISIKKPSFVLKPSILTQKAEEIRTDKTAINNTFGNVSGENKFLVLGNKMNNEICEKSAESVKIESSKGFVFGQNIFSRVVTTEGNQSDEKDTQEFKDLTGDNSSDQNNGEVNSDALRKNAEVATQKNNTKSLQETDTFTGEEDELSVSKMSCKLFQFDKDKKEWVGKGFCFVHVNDCKTGSKSRIVVRSKGGLKVIINSFIWSNMVLLKTSNKSLRITVQNEDGIKSYLLTMLNINDADNLYHQLSYRKAMDVSSSTDNNRKRDFSSSDNEEDDYNSKKRILSDNDE